MEKNSGIKIKDEFKVTKGIKSGTVNIAPGNYRPVKIIYRIAEKKDKTNKLKPDWVNNENCLLNAKKCFPNSEFHIFGDRLTDSKQLALDNADYFFEIKNHGNASSFMEVLDYVIENFEEDQIVYFLEDDYIHREGAEGVLLEGLGIADYLSLYDHPDKYDYEPYCSLLITESTHWRTVNSTTMTFATKVKNLVFDYETFKHYCLGYNIPQDYYIFSNLSLGNKRLITPIPGFATHGEIEYLAPLINWEKQL